MKKLEEKILKEGRLIGTDILKVDGFLNHMVDVSFMDEMAEVIAEDFGDKRPTKILTVEASGIALACSAARALGYIPVVFAKKAKPNTMIDEVYEADALSFTKRTVSTITVSKNFLTKDDRVLIVDDFLAHGETGLALCHIVAQAGAVVVGYSAAIEKKYQGGSQRLRIMGIDVRSLAVIEEIKDGQIVFG